MLPRSAFKYFSYKEMLKSHKIWYLSCIWLLTMFTGFLFLLGQTKHVSKKSKPKGLDLTVLLFLVPLQAGAPVCSTSMFQMIQGQVPPPLPGSERSQKLSSALRYNLWVCRRKREQPVDNCPQWGFGNWCLSCGNSSWHLLMVPALQKKFLLLKCIWLTLTSRKPSLRQHWDH